MTERDRPRIASVLAADADLELAPRTTAAFDADAHELADPFAID